MYFSRRKDSERKRPFVVVDKQFVNRKDLSWKAKGILLYLMSLPENWKLSMEDLKNRATDGAAALRTGIKELEEKKYFKKISIRDHKGKIIKWEYIFDEIPIEDEQEVLENENSEETSSEKEIDNDNPDCENRNVDYPECDYPDVENQHVENPLVDNRRLQNNKYTEQEYIQSNNNTNDIVELFDVNEKKREKTNEIIDEIIDYLNKKVDSNFRSSTSKTRIMIKSLLKDGFELNDFKKVIDKKTEEWLNTKMQKYLRPITLFRASNFENYLNELIVPPDKPQKYGGVNNAKNKRSEFFRGPTEDYYQKEFDPTKANIQ
jgi:uncharacterized phage protein (TIGR02220 family)